MQPRTATLAAIMLALALTACGKEDGAGALPKGEAIARIAPPAGRAWADTVAETAGGGMRMGNPEAPIKLLEYGSLTCPHCAKLSQESYASLVTNYVASGRVSYEFRSFAIHPQDVPLTVLVRCASKDAFFPLVEQIYANFEPMNAPYQNQEVMQRAEAAMKLPAQQRWGAFSDVVGYTAFFAARGVATDQTKACLADLPKAKAVADQSQKYGADGVNSTPTLFVNGVKLEANDWAGLEPVLQNAGAR